MKSSLYLWLSFRSSYSLKSIHRGEQGMANHIVNKDMYMQRGKLSRTGFFKISIIHIHWHFFLSFFETARCFLTIPDNRPLLRILHHIVLPLPLNFHNPLKLFFSTSVLQAYNRASREPVHNNIFIKTWHIFIRSSMFKL